LFKATGRLFRFVLSLLILWIHLSGGAACAQKGDDIEIKRHKKQVAGGLVQKGFEYFQRREYKLARESLVESLQYKGDIPAVYQMLGEIAYQEQDLKKAKMYLEQAFALQPDASLKEKLEQIEKELPVEENLDRYTAEHFIIRYNEEIKTYGGGFEIREYLRDAYESIGKDLGTFLRGKVVVILYDEEEYYRLSRGPTWAAGHFDGKIRLPAYRRKMTLQDLKATLWHELTHAFVQDLSKGRCPLWVHEGLAKYEENRVRPAKLTELKKVLRDQKFLSMTQLEQGLSEFSSASEVGLFYEQAFSVVRFMVARYRMYKVKKILEGLGSGNSWETALKEHLFLTPANLEKQWLNSTGEGS
jgi:tetratricopeptide (TPR) repeat protein